MKRRLVSLLLICALMLGTFAFSAFATEPHTHDNCEGVCTAAAQRSIQADICPSCWEQALVYNCGRDYETADIGSHGSCTVTYYTSRTVKYCNACQYSDDSEWHPFCDEKHSSCGKGVYATCTIEYY